MLRSALRSLLLATSLAVAAPAVAKDSLIVAIGGEPDDGYNPILGWGRYGHSLFHAALLDRDADLRTKPDLARSWTLSDDRRTWTVVIRDDARFSDGSALTADDVAFTYNTARSAGGIADVTVLDEAKVTAPNTITLTLKEPRITFVENFYSLGIVPAKTYMAMGEKAYARAPVGAGPFRMVRWDAGQQLITEANPYYYGPKPHFNRITFLFTKEDASLAAAQARQVDLITVPPIMASTTPPGMRMISVDSVDNRGLMLPAVPDTGTKSPKGMSVGNNVTADPAIRKAVNIAIDRSQLVIGALDGHGEPAYGPADGLPWGNPDARTQSADLTTANRILDEAGWVRTASGGRAKAGQPARFTILYSAADSTRQALALIVREQLKPVGIEAEPVGKSWDDIRRMMHANVVVFGWGNHDPLEVFQLYNSTMAGNGMYNVGYYQNAKVDGHFAAAESAPSIEASLALWRAAEWDGDTGFGMRGDAAWAWMVNLKHIYFADNCLDIGPTQNEPHGHGWPITAGVMQWKWTCK